MLIVILIIVILILIVLIKSIKLNGGRLDFVLAKEIKTIFPNAEIVDINEPIKIKYEGYTIYLNSEPLAAPNGLNRNLFIKQMIDINNKKFKSRMDLAIQNNYHCDENCISFSNHYISYCPKHEKVFENKHDGNLKFEDLHYYMVSKRTSQHLIEPIVNRN